MLACRKSAANLPALPSACSSPFVSTQPPDPRAEADPLRTQVYDALRSIARGQLARLAPGQTLQATALVHEAWLKLSAQDQQLPRATFAAAARSSATWIK